MTPQEIAKAIRGPSREMVKDVLIGMLSHKVPASEMARYIERAEATVASILRLQNAERRGDEAFAGALSQGAETQRMIDKQKAG